MSDRPSDRAIAQAFIEIVPAGDPEYQLSACIHADVLRRARAIDAAAPARAGEWVMVPRDSTANMEDAALAWMVGFQHMRKQDRRNAMANAYRAMLSAAPPAPQPALLSATIAEARQFERDWATFQDSLRSAPQPASAGQPTAEHWRRAIQEMVVEVGLSGLYPEELARIEQRAVALAREEGK